MGVADRGVNKRMQHSDSKILLRYYGKGEKGEQLN